VEVTRSAATAEEWHLSDHVRLEAAYGYGTLDRFSLTGAAQFLQSSLLQF
jgi:hypothetical protein